MPLLLLLSALLTALTGASAVARPLDVQIAGRAHSAHIVCVSIDTTPLRSGHMHLLGAFGVAQPFALSGGLATTAQAQRLYMDRLRA